MKFIYIFIGAILGCSTAEAATCKLQRAGKNYSMNEARLAQNDLSFVQLFTGEVDDISVEASVSPANKKSTAVAIGAEIIVHIEGRGISLTFARPIVDFDKFSMEKEVATVKTANGYLYLLCNFRND